MSHAGPLRGKRRGALRGGQYVHGAVSASPNQRSARSPLLREKENASLPSREVPYERGRAVPLERRRIFDGRRGFTMEPGNPLLDTSCSARHHARAAHALLPTLRRRHRADHGLPRPASPPAHAGPSTCRCFTFVTRGRRSPRSSSSRTFVYVGGGSMRICARSSMRTARPTTVRVGARHRAGRAQRRAMCCSKAASSRSSGPPDDRPASGCSRARSRSRRRRAGRLPCGSSGAGRHAPRRLGGRRRRGFCSRAHRRGGS